MQSTKMLTVEGNIGSGKSTFVSYLEENLKLNNNNNICFLQEPVDEWNKICDSNNRTIIECYYEDQTKYAFQFQMMAYITRLNKIKTALAEGYDYIIMERSLLTDRLVFAQMLRDEKKISDIEFAIYTKWFDSFQDDIPKCSVVYLQTTASVALDRVCKRARKGEIITLEYLEKCQSYHDRWLLSNSDTLILDGNQENTQTVYKDWCQSVTSFLKNEGEPYMPK